AAARVGDEPVEAGCEVEPDARHGARLPGRGSLACRPAVHSRILAGRRRNIGAMIAKPESMEVRNGRPASGHPELDRIDLRLLEALQRNARSTYAELGALVNLKPPAVPDRVKRLESRGFVLS